MPVTYNSHTGLMFQTFCFYCCGRLIRLICLACWAAFGSGKLGEYPITNQPKCSKQIQIEYYSNFMQNDQNTYFFLYIFLSDQQLPESEIKTYKILFLGSSEVISCSLHKYQPYCNNFWDCFLDCWISGGEDVNNQPVHAIPLRHVHTCQSSAELWRGPKVT